MLKALIRHEWLGNVRELENVIQRFVVLGNEEVIIDELNSIQRKETLWPDKESVQKKKQWPSLKEVHREAINKAEGEVIRKALELTNWNRKRASEILNISYKALLYKIKDCGIDRRMSALPA
jgi:two-component system response regulator AtoC